MLNKVWESAAGALADLGNGATVMIGGFAEAGKPNSLLLALRDHGVTDLTIISNGVGRGDENPDVLMLIARGVVRKVICTFFGPVGKPSALSEGLAAGTLEAEMIPQGTFSERLRAGGAGIPAFYTPTGAGTVLATGKETRVFGGRECVLEEALTADFALIRAHRADRLGNLEYRRTGRNLNPMMAAAARTTIAEVDHIVEIGAIDPESVGTSGIYVNRIVQSTHPTGVRRD